MQMTEFMYRRLMQMPQLGASIIVRGYHKGDYFGKFEVSTVRFANHEYTRVKSLDHDRIWHYYGIVETTAAANDAAAECWLMEAQA